METTPTSPPDSVALNVVEELPRHFDPQRKPGFWLSGEQSGDPVRGGSAYLPPQEGDIGHELHPTPSVLSGSIGPQDVPGWQSPPPRMLYGAHNNPAANSTNWQHPEGQGSSSQSLGSYNFGQQPNFGPFSPYQMAIDDSTAHPFHKQ